MSVSLPSGIHTLSDMFDFAADQYPTREVGTFAAEDSVTFRQLAHSGHATARKLVAMGVLPGTPVAVMIRSVLDLLPVIHGIAAAGAVVVPLPVPVSTSRAGLARLRHVVDDCGVQRALVDDVLAPYLAEALPGIEPVILTSLTRGAGHGTLPAVDADDLAIIQYTSGSTSDPRGVALSHRNVLAGIRALHHGTGVRTDDVLCHWLPLSHDMGLFSTLAALSAGVGIRVSSPAEFVKHPDDWLGKFCEFGATISVGPNFSYRHIIDSIPREDAPDYDLSAVRVLLNGAEPIDPPTVIAFGEHFAASGLAPQAMTPCYGLAEATLAVTIVAPHTPVTVDWVDRDALNRTQQARTVHPGASNARGVVNCGRPVPGVEVRIADGGRALADRVVGEIEIRGESVMRGYYHRTAPFPAPDGWCPTGDLGYLAGSCLHVTGRKKEILICGGRNHYPQDIEEAVRRAAGVHRQQAVAVLLQACPAAGGPERIGVLAEVAVARPPYHTTVSAIRQAAAQELDGASVDVVLLRRNTLLRTTSGKYQRLLMRQQLMAGGLDGVLVHVTAEEHVSQAERSASSLV